MEEVGRGLCNLRLLNISQRPKLEVIVPSLLERFTNLEELHLSFDCTDKDVGNEYALFSVQNDLKSLHRLTAFSGFLGSIHSLPSGFRFEKLRMYRINCSHHIDRSRDNGQYYSKILQLGSDGHDLSRAVKVFEQLFSNLEFLLIDGPMEDFQNMVLQIEDAGFQNLKELFLANSTYLQCLIDTTGAGGGLPRPLPIVTHSNLVYLVLENLPQLSEICHGLPPTHFFANLKSVTIIYCPRLQHIFPVEEVLERLHTIGCYELKSLTIIYIFPVGKVLERLRIFGCYEPQNVYELQALLLPCLTYIQLEHLSKLERVRQGSHELKRDIEVSESCLAEKLEIVRLILLQALWLHAEGTHIGGVVTDRMADVLNGPIHQPESASFGRLQHVRIEMCHELRNIFTLSMVIALPQLQSVNVAQCDKLEHVFDDEGGEELESASSQNIDCIVPEFTCLPKLEDIKISHCKKLRSMWPLSMVHNAFQCLGSLSIEHCSELEHVFNDDKRAGKDSEKLKVIHLPSLQFLQLSHLPKLLGFTPEGFRVHCLRLQTLDTEYVGFPYLHKPDSEEYNHFRKLYEGFVPIRVQQSLAEIKKLIICNSNGIEEAIDVEENADYIKQPVLRNLELLQISLLPDLKYIFNGPTKFVDLSNLWSIELTGCWNLKGLFKTTNSSYNVCFPKLMRLKVLECWNLETLFLTSMLTTLSNLYSLKVEECPKLEYIFDNEIRELNTSKLCFEEVQLPDLGKLYLDKLPGLRSFAPANYRVLCPLLNKVKLKVSSSEDRLLLDITQQEVLETMQRPMCNNYNGVLLLKHCVKSIKIADYYGEQVFDGETNVHGKSWQYWEINELELRCLPNLKCLWKGFPEPIKLNFLRVISINDCRLLMNSLFTAVMTRSLEFLEIVKVSNCRELENIFDPGRQEHGYSSDIYFPSLREITVNGCDRLKTVFPLSVVQRLPELMSLHIKGACQLKEIFTQDDGREEENSCELNEKLIDLPKLSTLHLEQLPRLSGICPAGYALCCTSSVDLQIRDCSSMDGVECFTQYLKEISIHRKRKTIFRVILRSSVSSSLQCSQPSEALDLSNIERVFKEGVLHLEQSFSEKLVIASPSHLPPKCTAASWTASQSLGPSDMFSGISEPAGWTSSDYCPSSSAFDFKQSFSKLAITLSQVPLKFTAASLIASPPFAPSDLLPGGTFESQPTSSGSCFSAKHYQKQDEGMDVDDILMHQKYRNSKRRAWLQEN